MTAAGSHWVNRGADTGAQLLFGVPYSAYYASDLSRLCKEYGITEMSAGSYKIQGHSGKDFKLVFFEQPQLTPDAEKSDFPLSVWKTEVGHVGAGAVETQMDTLEEAQLGAALAASALADRPDRRLTDEVR